MLRAIFVILLALWLLGLVFVVHPGWIPPYPAFAGDHRAIGSGHSGTKSSVATDQNNCPVMFPNYVR